MKSANKDLRDELPDRIAQCQVEHHQFCSKDSDSFSTECLCTVSPKIKPLKQKEATSRLYLGLDPPSKNAQNVCLVFCKCVCEVSKQLSLRWEVSKQLSLRREKPHPQRGSGPGMPSGFMLLLPRRPHHDGLFSSTQ